MTLRLLLCAEDVLSATLARDLCDRVVRERARAEWLRALWSPEHIDSQRRWVGLDPSHDWSDRGAVEREALRMKLRPHVRVPETGRLHAPRGAASLGFRAATVAARLDPRPDVLVIAGDTEGVTEPERLRAEGVRVADEGVPALVAEAHREAEAWVTAGFVADCDAERERLATLTRELGFDPTEHPERLLAGVAGDPRDSKRVCRTLLGADGVTPWDARARSCWLDTPLDRLAERGRAAGVAAYIAQVEAVLLPLLGDDGGRR